MNKTLFGAALCIGVLAMSPTFARRNPPPMNATVVTTSLPNGAVSMTIRMDAQAGQTVSRNMRPSGMTCTLQENTVGGSETMTLVCSPNK